MKIISLNCWGGQKFEALMEFIESQKDSTDIFLFQEIFDTTTDKTESNGARANLLAEIENRLPGFTVYRAFVEGSYDYEGPVDFDLKFGLTSFVRNSVEIINRGDILVHGEPGVFTGEFGYHPRNLQYFKINHNGSPLTLCNLHGLWNREHGKRDFPDRISQSQKVREFFDKTNGAKILMGDLNLEPDTQSLAILERGIVNMIKTFNITTTRSAYYDKPVKFADYTLISPEIEVVNFEVPNILASDHLPMILEIK